MKVTTDACLFGAWVANEILKTQNEPDRILDIGAGTGLLSLMLAQATEWSQIDAVEINAAALKEANFNFMNSSWNERLKVFHTAIQNFNPTLSYDLIICNPPFFAGSQKGKKTGKNQAVHASSLSMSDLLAAAKKRLSASGKLYLLYPKREMEDFISLSTDELFLEKLVIVRNQKKDPVFRQLAIFSQREASIEKDELTIRTIEGKYTDGFWELLKDYYLEYNNPSKK